MAPSPLPNLEALVEAPAEPAAPATFEERARFVFAGARLLAELGEASAGIESSVELVAQRLGLSASVVAIPSAIFCTLSTAEAQWTEVLRIRAPIDDFARRATLQRLALRVMRGELGAVEGSARLAQLSVWPEERRAALWDALFCGLASLASALLLGAPGRELLLSTGLGALVGLLSRLARRHPTLAGLTPVVLAALVSAVAFGASRLGLGEMRPVPVLISSLLRLLPGAQLTAAMAELATGHWTSGAGRLLAAATRLLLLVVGVVVGQQASQSVGVTQVTMPLLPAIAWWQRALAPGVAGAAFWGLYQARRQDAGIILAGCYVGALGNTAGAGWLGSYFGAFLGAFAVAAFSLRVGLWREVPAAIVQQPSVLLLVPGSVGFLSVGSLLQDDVQAAISTGFQTLFIAISIALGAMSGELTLPAEQRVARMLERG